MEESTLYTRHKETFDKIDRIPTVLFVLSMCVLLLPLFRYKSSVVLLTNVKSNLYAWNIMKEKFIWFVVVAGVAAGTGHPGRHVKKNTWEKKIKGQIIQAAIESILWLICVFILFQFDSYPITVSEVEFDAPIERGIGCYVLIIINLIGQVYEWIILRKLWLLHTGERTEEELFPKTTQAKPVAATTTATTAKPAPATAEAPTAQTEQSLEDKLKNLAKLKEVGLLTDEEFAKKKAEILEKY